MGCLAQLANVWLGFDSWPTWHNDFRTLENDLWFIYLSGTMMGCGMWPNYLLTCFHTATLEGVGKPKSSPAQVVCIPQRLRVAIWP